MVKYCVRGSGSRLPLGYWFHGLVAILPQHARSCPSVPCLPQVVFETTTHHPEPRPGLPRAQTVPAHAPPPLPSGSQAPAQLLPPAPGTTPGEQLVHERSLERQTSHQDGSKPPHTPPTSPGAASPGCHPLTAAQPHGRPPLAPNRQRSSEPSRSPKTVEGGTARPYSPFAAATAAAAPLAAAAAMQTPGQPSGGPKQLPAGSALSSPSTAAPAGRQHQQQQQQQYAAQPLIPPLPYPYGAVRTADGASLYGVWADMALRGILAAVREPEASVQLSLLLTSAVSSCHVPVVQLPTLSNGAEAEAGALTGTPGAPAAVLLRPLSGDVGASLPPLWRERVHQKQQQEKQQQRRDLLLQDQEGLDSPRQRERDQQRPAAPSPGPSTAAGKHPHGDQCPGSATGTTGRPVSPVRRLFIPSLYPPMCAEEDGHHDGSSQHSSTTCSTPGGPQGAAPPCMHAASGVTGASDGKCHGSNDNNGNDTASSGGYDDFGRYAYGRPGLVVVEVDERHPDFVALADAYCGGGGGGGGGGTAGGGEEEGVWARTARLLGPLMRRLPREVERGQHRVAGGQGQGQGYGMGQGHGVGQGQGTTQGHGCGYQSGNVGSSSGSHAGRHDSSCSGVCGEEGRMRGPPSLPPGAQAAPSIRERGAPPPDLAQASQGGLVGSGPLIGSLCSKSSPAASLARPATPGKSSPMPEHVAAPVGSTGLTGLFRSLHGAMARSPGVSPAGSPASSSASSSPAPSLPGAAGKEGAAGGEAGRAQSSANGVACHAPSVVPAGAGNGVCKPVTRGRFVVVSETR